jgi:hypothetical protein
MIGQYTMFILYPLWGAPSNNYKGKPFLLKQTYIGGSITSASRKKTSERQLSKPHLAFLNWLPCPLGFVMPPVPSAKP